MALTAATATTLVELRTRLAVEDGTVGQDGGCFGPPPDVKEGMDEGGTLMTELIARKHCVDDTTWHTHRGPEHSAGPAPPTGMDLAALLAGSMASGRVRRLLVLADEGVYIVSVHPRLPELAVKLSPQARDVLLAVALPGLTAISEGARTSGKNAGPAAWARSISEFKLKDLPAGASALARDFAVLVLGGARPWLAASFLTWDYLAGLALPRLSVVDRLVDALRRPQTVPRLP